MSSYRQLILDSPIYRLIPQSRQLFETLEEKTNLSYDLIDNIVRKTYNFVIPDIRFYFSILRIYNKYYNQNIILDRFVIGCVDHAIWVYLRGIQDFLENFDPLNYDFDLIFSGLGVDYYATLMEFGEQMQDFFVQVNYIDKKVNLSFQENLQFVDELVGILWSYRSAILDLTLDDFSRYENFYRFE